MAESEHDPCRYELDARNVIFDVNEEWVEFARLNEAPELTRDAVVGRSIWDFIADVQTRHLYELLFTKVRTEQVDITVPFRCDSPTMRRFMELRMRPLSDNSLQLEGILLRAEPRIHEASLDRTVSRSDEVVMICSWCKRIDVGDDTWLEVEDAIGKLQLFDSGSLPLLSHGACPTCFEKVMETLKSQDGG